MKMGRLTSDVACLTMPIRATPPSAKILATPIVDWQHVVMILTTIVTDWRKAPERKHNYDLQRRWQQDNALIEYDGDTVPNRVPPSDRRYCCNAGVITVKQYRCNKDTTAH